MRRPPADPARLPYMTGLDGVRALAVTAVVLYHLDVSWLPGGFLGVDMFFVVSGFLITSLLLADVRRRGRFDVKDFWWRRARRLLPALVVMVMAVILYVAVFLPDELGGLRVQVLAAGGYVTNWALILTDTSYFEAFARPPLLRHLWSLAVEEQFYLLWPVAFAAGWALLRRRMLSVVWLGAAGSALLMALLYEPLADPSRVYFGTDTRAVGLLVGVGLAYVTTPARLVWAPSGAPLVRRELAGWAGLAGLAALMVLGSEFSTAMYRGGFLLAAAATLALIVGAAGPTLLARLLSFPALVWVGRRSYGIYLWHWPVLMLTRPELDVSWDGGRLLALRVGLTVALAAASYRWIERPIIAKGFGGWLRGDGSPRRTPVTARLRVAAAAGVLVAVVATLSTLAVAPEQVLASTVGSTMPGAEAPVDEEIIASAAAVPEVVSVVPRADAAAPSTTGEPRPAHTERSAPPAPEAPRSAPATTFPSDEGLPLAQAPTTTAPPPESTTTTPPDPPLTIPPEAAEAAAAEERPPRITAVGDSVMLGAAEALGKALGPSVTVDGLVSRSFADGAALLAAMADAGELGDIVVVHLGTNGPIDEALVEQLMTATEGADRVLALTVRVPRRWEDQVNKTLHAAAERSPRLELVDWHTASDGRPELFVDDGVHLTKKGRNVYAKLVAKAVAR